MSEEEARAQFILGLRARGVTDKAVLDAMERTPRAAFVENLFRDRANEDTALPIGSGQTISQPTVVGIMTQALKVNRRSKVLEVGTGSGYQAAVLAHLVRRVYTTERHRPLARRAAKVLADLGLSNVTVIPTDGAFGLPEQAPFDRIIVTAAAEDPPGPLLEQLATGGVMVVPVGQSDTVQTLLKVLKTDDGLEYQSLGDVRFVPLLEGMAKD